MAPIDARSAYFPSGTCINAPAWDRRKETLDQFFGWIEGFCRWYLCPEATEKDFITQAIKYLPGDPLLWYPAVGAADRAIADKWSVFKDKVRVFYPKFWPCDHQSVLMLILGFRRKVNLTLKEWKGFLRWFDLAMPFYLDSWCNDALKARYLWLALPPRLMTQAILTTRNLTPNPGASVSYDQITKAVTSILSPQIPTSVVSTPVPVDQLSPSNPPALSSVVTLTSRPSSCGAPGSQTLMSPTVDGNLNHDSMLAMLESSGDSHVGLDDCTGKKH